MCRSKVHGGRKCPSQNDPVRRAIHNAKRRAKYQASKNGVVVSEVDLDIIAKAVEHNMTKDNVQEEVVKPKTSKTKVKTVKKKEVPEPSINVEDIPKNMVGKKPETPEEIASVNNEPLMEPEKNHSADTDIIESSAPVEQSVKKKSSVKKTTPAKKEKVKKKIIDAPVEEKTTKNPVLSIEFENKQGEALFTVNEKSRAMKALNIKKQKNEGLLAENSYFSSVTVTGTINYNNLNSSSYKQFGFKTVEKDKTAFEKSRTNDLSQISLFNLSEHEVSELDFEEKQSLRYFTTNNYKWLNNALYSKDSYSSLPAKNTKKEEIFDKNTDHPDSWYDKTYQTKETLQKITEKLDETLKKGPKQQRIVYRGLSPDAPAFHNKSMKEWFNDDISLGSELKFDGYQSSSYNFNAAQNFSEGRGVVFEILTPEGIHVTANSDFTTENEVILPRGARYMVVGKHDGFSFKNYAGVKRDSSMCVVQLVAINDKGEILDGTNSTYEEPIKK